MLYNKNGYLMQMKEILDIYKSVASISYILHHILEYDHIPYYIFLYNLLIYYINSFSALANLIRIGLIFAY